MNGDKLIGYYSGHKLLGRNGAGSLKYESSEYIGQFVNDKFHGNGCLSLPDDKKLEGKFICNKFIQKEDDDLVEYTEISIFGLPKYSYFGAVDTNYAPNGFGSLKNFDTNETFCGQFEHGRRQAGVVRYVYADGTIYDGEFINNLFAGVGRMLFSDGEYAGQFQNDSRHGIGKYIFNPKTNIGNTFYIGEFVQG